MALSESALSELVVALTDREHGVDLVRELAQWLAQELIEVQATQAIGAGRYERGCHHPLPLPRNNHRHAMGDHTGTRSLTAGSNSWRAGCGESRTSGSEGGSEKPTRGNADRALRSDPYPLLVRCLAGHPNPASTARPGEGSPPHFNRPRDNLMCPLPHLQREGPAQGRRGCV
jgi:hypothetical protein